MKLLVGRRFDDPDVQKEISLLPYKAVKMPHGGVGVSVLYNDEQLVVSVEHFMSMLLVKVKEIVSSANNGLNLADCVLACPHWYSMSQRRGILHAAEIAQVNCLKVTNESNAIALSYGIFKSAKKLFSETEPVHIMFVDIGFTGRTVFLLLFNLLC
jgi:heat shock protein 4